MNEILIGIVMLVSGIFLISCLLKELSKLKLLNLKSLKNKKYKEVNENG